MKKRQLKNYIIILLKIENVQLNIKYLDMFIIQIITIIVIISCIVMKNKQRIVKKREIIFDVNFENYTAYEQIKYLNSLNINTLEYPFDVKMYL